MQAIRWAIVGSGPVSQNFSRALKKTPGAVAQATISRDPAHARDFAKKFGFAAGLALTADVFKRPDIDIFYIATPTATHRDFCLQALEAGKAVLCEKPMTTSPEELRDLQRAAQARNLFVMEGMWLRFNTVVGQIRECLHQGRIGEVLSAEMSIGYLEPPTAEKSRDALSTYGCYGLSLAHLLFGAPQKICASGRVVGHEAVVHADAALLYPGFKFLLRQSVIATLANALEIVGTRGRLTIPAHVVDPRRMAFSAHGRLGAVARIRGVIDAVGDQTNFPRFARGSGFVNEIAAVNECLRKGLTECPTNPLAATLSAQQMQQLCRESVARDGRWLDCADHLVLSEVD